MAPCTVGAVYFRARDISRIEAALPLASQHKERDFTAFHLDLAKDAGKNRYHLHNPERD